jgi:hypothetical protein
MATINDIANVQITKETVYPTKAGFNIPMFAVYHSSWADIVRSVADISELDDLNVPTYLPLYRGIQAAFSQNPRPTAVVVGRRALAFTQIVKLSPQITTTGYVYKFEIEDAAGVVTAIAYTVLSGASTTTVAAALAALIDALTDVAATSALGVITATTTAGKITTYKSLPPLDEMKVQSTGTDPGIATDLSAIELAASKAGLSWYGFSIDEVPEAVANAAATWAEARQVLFLPRTSDSQCADVAVTDDICSDLQDAAYARSGALFAQKDTHDFRDLAWLAKMLPKEVGAATWAYKTLNGISADTLTSGQRAVLDAKLCSYYVTVKGVNVTFEGHTADGDYLDNTVSLDFTHARIQEDVFGLQVTNDKIGFTESGIEQFRLTVQNRLDKSTSDPNPIFSPDVADAPKAYAPKVAATDGADRAARTLRQITFTARLQGAIHKVNVKGTVSV